MRDVGQRESLTQAQVLTFFQEHLGYRYLGDWKDRYGNSNIERGLLRDWHNPENNDFAVAEEVTVVGANTKRPDVVLYVNGIALGVLELKRSTVAVAEGIRQNL